MANTREAADGRLSAVLREPGCGWTYPSAGAGQGSWPLWEQGRASAATGEPGVPTCSFASKNSEDRGTSITRGMKRLLNVKVRHSEFSCPPGMASPSQELSSLPAPSQAPTQSCWEPGAGAGSYGWIHRAFHRFSFPHSNAFANSVPLAVFQTRVGPGDRAATRKHLLEA